MSFAETEALEDPPPPYVPKVVPAADVEGPNANVLKSLPAIDHVEGFYLHGASAWAKAYRIDAKLKDGSSESFFMKMSEGHHGYEALKGEYEATAAIHAIIPDFVPKPIAWGTCEGSPDTHFYVCKFYELDTQLPDKKPFCEMLAKLHHHHLAPQGKFGFHVVTYNGDIPQKNDPQDSWEVFFAEGLKHIFKLNLERGGPCPEFDDLMPDLFDKVIPRLIRPLETAGNSIEPSLVHGDLWCGNAATDEETNRPIVYDPSSFWAHNEYELGNWRPERNKFSRDYFSAYHEHYPIAAPREDYEDRNALYAMRFNLHAATLFPKTASFREMVINEMKTLIQKYPGGYDEWKRAHSA